MAGHHIISQLSNIQEKDNFLYCSSKFSIGLRFICLSFFFFFNFIATLFIYFFIFGCVGSSVRARAFSSYGKRGPLLIAVRGPFTTAAPPVAGHRLQTRRLSSCGPRAQPLRGMWDPPRPGLEPVSPALAGRLSTTAPPGKPLFKFLIKKRNDHFAITIN